MQRQAVATMKAPPIERAEGLKWELDTQPWLDKIFNQLLGKSTNEHGVWVDDPYKQKVMNELGASEFCNEISGRVSIHMQLSELDEADINEVASRAAEIYGDKIEDNWARWEIEPTCSNMESIAQRLYDILFISLRIAKGGGMKKHRERTKNPYATILEKQAQMQEEPGVM